MFNMLNKTLSQTADTQLNQRIQELAHCLLVFRKMQDKAGTELVASLGNLSSQELNLINIIGDTEPCIMSDIAKQAMLSLSSITVIVDKLVKTKLVKRVRSEEDRRVVRGSLTEEGKKIYLIQIEHMHGILRKALNVLPIEEQENFLKIFQKITQTSF